MEGVIKRVGYPTLFICWYREFRVGYIDKILIRLIGAIGALHLIGLMRR